MQKTLFFDLGNVLVFFSRLRMYEQLGRLIGLPSYVIQKELSTNDLGDQCERGKVTSQMLHQHLSTLTKNTFSLDALIDALCTIFIPNWSMLPLLAELKRKQHRLLLLSNTNDAHFSHIQRHYPELLQPFDDFILSYEIGAIKPEEAIFKTALMKTTTPPAQCFYIDDIPLYIEAAARVDIPGMVFTGLDPLIDELKAREFL
jgi:glucose-1-phosphatase